MKHGVDDLVLKLGEAVAVLSESEGLRDARESSVGLDDEEFGDDVLELVHPNLEQVELCTHEDRIPDFRHFFLAAHLPAM